MLPNLTANEIRVLGCLMEKSVTTPDHYPLTLSSLTNACNQKSSRSPVMSLEKGEVGSTVRELEQKHLVKIEENFKSGVEKYHHLMHSAQFSLYEFDAAQFAVICLLLLRGPQTPGELRTRSGRLHEFEDNSAVVHTLNQLIGETREDFVTKLPRTPGRKDSEYMHLFGGPIEARAADENVSQIPGNAKPRPDKYTELSRRVSVLEEEVESLKKAQQD